MRRSVEVWSVECGGGGNGGGGSGVGVSNPCWCQSRLALVAPQIDDILALYKCKNVNALRHESAKT